MVYACCQISFHLVYLSPSGSEKQDFAIFGLQHFVVSPVGSSLRKMSTGVQLQTFPYTTVS